MCQLCSQFPSFDWHAPDGPQLAGTAEGGTSNGTSVTFNPSLVDQLDSGAKWYAAGGAAPTTISYGFPTSGAFAGTMGEADRVVGDDAAAEGCHPGNHDNVG